MKNLLVFLLLASTLSNFAQIKGKVTDCDGNPLPAVAVIVDNTYKNTTSNEQGDYTLDFKTAGKHTLVFQSLGYKTQKININIDQFPFTQNIKRADTNLTLSEVVINPKENPANGIIRNAI